MMLPPSGEQAEGLRSSQGLRIWWTCTAECVCRII